jgi:hypothetical protein
VPTIKKSLFFHYPHLLYSIPLFLRYSIHDPNTPEIKRLLQLSRITALQGMQRMLLLEAKKKREVPSAELSVYYREFSSHWDQFWSQELFQPLDHHRDWNKI